jgi:hypothetical protein
MSKMGSHDPFGYLKHKLWPKEGLGVKLPIWFSTIKSQESPWFPCVQVMCHILLKRSWQELQLCFRPHFNRRSTHKVMGLQSCGSPNFGSSKTKWHLGASHVARHREYYKEGDGFPQVWAVVSFVNLCLLVANLCLLVVHPCTKSAPTTHQPTCCLVCAGQCE